MDWISLIAIECEDLWIWLRVCKHFWTCEILREKLLRLHNRKLDNKFFEKSVLPYGVFNEDGFIVIYASRGDDQ